MITANGIFLRMWQQDEDDADDDKADTPAEAMDSADEKLAEGKVATDEKPAEGSKDASAEEKKHVRELSCQLRLSRSRLHFILLSLLSCNACSFLFTVVQDEL